MPSSMSMLCILLILFSFNNASLAAGHTNTSDSDRQALLCFKSGISSDPLGILGSWSNENFCSWQGVTCSTKSPLRVVSLELTSVQLSGQLSGCIARMTSLSQINFTDNHLSGIIPEELGKLPDLQTLSLSGNKLEGNIPSSLGSSMSLSSVNLADNSLTGGIPKSLASSSLLRTLILSRNKLSGRIPYALFDNSSTLGMVDLQMNSFTGPIPPFSNIVALKYLGLTGNLLSGIIPPSIENASSLTYVLLGQNKLSGFIPATLYHLAKLLELDLSFNSLSGDVPLSVNNISSLKSFRISNNLFVGQIPSHIGHFLPNLQFLHMGSNKLEGLIPTSLANMSNLQVLDLSNNLLRGSIPSLGSLVNLQQLVSGDNQLESDGWVFLSYLVNCTQLIKLSLEGNILNGSLPTSVGNLSENLQGLVLGGNLISGTIPSTIGNLQKLYILDLSKNKLSGQIPSSVGYISQLGHLYLDQNNFSGNIPVSLGQCKGLLELNLSTNSFDGSIPVELFIAPPLSLGVDFSHNNLTGELPSLKGCPLSLHMEGNKIYGQIPESFRALVCTQQINLSHNDLSGTVPEFFGDFTTLEQLDLSYNNLEGPVPTSGIFKNSTAVVLEGNKGLCSWSSILGLRICAAVSRTGRKKWVTLLLVIMTLLTIALLLSWFLFTLWKKRVFSFPRHEDVLKILSFVASRKRTEVYAYPIHKETLKKVSYGEILKATNYFSSVHTISTTCTGSVYVGRFKSDKSLAAIKVFNLKEPGAYGSYFIECEVLRSTRHRNIMRPVTLCSTVDLQNHEFKALIFEFMVNGSLKKWLHPEGYCGTIERVLSLGQRICIAADLAFALDYVHNQLKPPLIHCDLKPSNVLLDDNMTALLSDFGSAKFLLPGLNIPRSLVDVGGTIGYIAPEYAMGCEISSEGDVYSFGVLLLEMLTGKQPTDDMFVDGLTIHKFVDSMFPDRVTEILDPHMAHEEDQEVWMKSYIIPMVALGLSCSRESAKDRPGMRDVCAKLSGLKEVFLGPCK